MRMWLALMMCVLFSATLAAQQIASWQPAGWGGGGWYWAAVFHPTKDGVIYLGQDTGGVSKTTDHGMHWRMINTGLTDYSVYSLAVDRSNPETVYAATEGGLHKSTDGGDHWKLLPNTGPKELRITAERSKSVRAIAVDPTNGNILYAASPAGKLYKSVDGGQSWKDVYTQPSDKPLTIYSVAVAAKNPSLVVAATAGAGLVLSEDAGETWRELLNTPKTASSAVFAETDPNIMYASFMKEGVWKSTDQGKTWARSSEGMASGGSVLEVAVSPVNALDVYAIGSSVYLSNDGGATWKQSSQLKTDLEGNPTRHYNGESPTTKIGNPKNITINPLNPREIYISADWRSAWSEDGGLTWSERERGSDITCNTDIRFSGGRVYATAMDEGVLMSEDNGANWRQLWPPKYIPRISGHYWRVAVDNIDGVDRLISTASPWDTKVRRVVISQDGGKTYTDTTSGLPDYIPTPNTMWQVGHPRALAVDPNDRNVVYLGLDGDAEEGKMGGGIFKSEDGGMNWKQLPNQPGSRRMFYGLAVDPTDSKRIFWGTCGDNGGLYRSEDGGASWTRVFDKEQWIFNVLVTKEGVVYCPGNDLWRSTDHGKSWKKLTQFEQRKQIMGLEVDPRDPKTLWISSNNGVFKTTDDGATWQDITGDLPYRRPQVLRFNPATNELWAGWVGLHRIKQ